MKKLLAILFLIPAISFAAETDYIATPILADIQNGTDNDNQINTLRVGGQSFLMGTVNFGTVPVTASGSGSKEGSTVQALENGNGVIFKTTLTCTATPISFTDQAGIVQYSGTKVYTFPGGMILVLGAVIDGVFTGTAPFVDAFVGDVALGTVTASNNATLTETEQNILANTEITADAKVAPADAQSAATLLTESAACWLDGTAAEKEMFLNILVDDHDDHIGTLDGTFTGTIEFAWLNIGDN